MSDNYLQTGVDFEVNGTAEAKSLATAVSGVADSIRDLGRAANTIAGQVEKIERGLAGIGKSARQAQQGLTGLATANTKSISDQFKATRELQKFGANPDFAATRAALGIDLEAREQQKVTDAIKAQNVQRKAQLELMRQARAQGGYGPKLETGTGPGSAEAVGKRFIASGTIFRQEAEAQAQGLEKVKQANLSAAKAELEHMNRLTNLRYTLYDVQRSFLTVGVALAAFNVLTLKAAMDYETAMAQIQRTSSISGQAIQNIREDFVDLAQSIPTAFSELSKIGTLGGQLNIPAANLADFTKVVAQFSATTNVAVEQSATAFGRLDALLPDVQGNYNALGSSILQVGINSVATESEIINTTNQIAAAGQQAGLSANQIIGLAASFASLGVAPEAARGTTIRFFSTINTAISEGGSNLTKFAQLSGKTADEFTADWGSNAGEAFLDLLNGMQKVSAEGTNLESVIRSMGITAVRDINALLKLSQNAEIVGSNFGYAADGFNEATQLGAAFEVQASTLASKIQVLVNSVQAFFAEMGQEGVPIVGFLVDGLKNLVIAFTELAQNPALQIAATIIGGFTALVAVVSLAGFAFTRLTSATIAVRTALATMKAEALAASGGLTGASAAASGLTGALFGSTAAAKAFRGALLTTGIGAAAVAIGVLADGVINLIEGMRPATEKAKDFFGDLSTLSEALEKDTEAARNGAKVYGEVSGELTRTTSKTADWASELNRVTGTQTTLDGAVVTTNDSIGEQTYKIGENTAAWIANQLANDESIAKFLQWSKEVEAQGGPSFDTGGFLTALTKNDSDAARSIINSFRAEYETYLREVSGEKPSLNTREIQEAENAITLYAGAVDAAAVKSEIYNTVMKVTGNEQLAAAASSAELTDELENVGSALDTIRDSIEAAYSASNLISAMSDDFYNLATGIYESGTAFDTFNQSGIDNLNNFQQSIGSIIAYGETLGLSASQSVAALFVQLQKMGVDTASLLAGVARIPGVVIGDVKNAMASSNPAMEQYNKILGGIGGTAEKTVGSTRKVGKAAKDVKKEIVSLVDYANDLRGVFDRAFNIRFGGDQAIDKITSGWESVATATQEALDNMRGLQAEMQQLSADKSIYEYFLGVADMYNDTLRAQDIRAKLADINGDLADTSKELTKEQSKASKSLEGNSEAAIDNRATILGMVQTYQDLIEQYAASGMSQAELAQKAQQLKSQFVQQASQLGYNVQELDKYTRSFDDVSAAIARVPRNITVTADTNPATQALNEFLAKASQSSANVSLGASGDGYGAGYNAGLAYADGWIKASAKRKIVTVADASIPGGKKYTVEGSGQWFFKKGGYTGNVGTSQAAGVVHGKEFVVNAENTAKFRPILEAMNRGQMPVMRQGASAMPSTMQVELSPYDRQLLSAAGNVQLFLSGQQVAGAVAGANVVSTNRGSG